MWQVFYPIRRKVPCWYPDTSIKYISSARFSHTPISASSILQYFKYHPTTGNYRVTNWLHGAGVASVGLNVSSPLDYRACWTQVSSESLLKLKGCCITFPVKFTVEANTTYYWMRDTNENLDFEYDLLLFKEYQDPFTSHAQCHAIGWSNCCPKKDCCSYNLRNSSISEKLVSFAHISDIDIVGSLI